LLLSYHVFLNVSHTHTHTQRFLSVTRHSTLSVHCSRALVISENNYSYLALLVTRYAIVLVPS